MITIVSHVSGNRIEHRPWTYLVPGGPRLIGHIQGMCEPCIVIDESVKGAFDWDSHSGLGPSKLVQEGKTLKLVGTSYAKDEKILLVTIEESYPNRWGAMDTYDMLEQCKTNGASRTSPPLALFAVRLKNEDETFWIESTQRNTGKELVSTLYFVGMQGIKKMTLPTDEFASSLKTQTVRTLGTKSFPAYFPPRAPRPSLQESA